MKKMILSAACVLLVLTAAVLAGCNESEPAADPQLDVTPYNMAGYWTVSMWNGRQLDESTYVYLNLVRKERTFELYDNLNSFSVHRTTGEYNIYTDEEKGAMIRGRYDYGNGEWSHRYIVSSLTAGQMVWVAADDETIVTVYERVEAIPEDIVNAFPDEE